METATVTTIKPEERQTVFTRDYWIPWWGIVLLVLLIVGGFLGVGLGVYYGTKHNESKKCKNRPTAPRFDGWQVTNSPTGWCQQTRYIVAAQDKGPWSAETVVHASPSTANPILHSGLEGATYWKRAVGLAHFPSNSQLVTGGTLIDTQTPCILIDKPSLIELERFENETGGGWPPTQYQAAYTLEGPYSTASAVIEDPEETNPILKLQATPGRALFWKRKVGTGDFTSTVTVLPYGSTGMYVDTVKPEVPGEPRRAKAKRNMRPYRVNNNKAQPRPDIEHNPSAGSFSAYQPPPPDTYQAYAGLQQPYGGTYAEAYPQPYEYGQPFPMDQAYGPQGPMNQGAYPQPMDQYPPAAQAMGPPEFSQPPFPQPPEFQPPAFPPGQMFGNQAHQYLYPDQEIQVTDTNNKFYVNHNDQSCSVATIPSGSYRVDALCHAVAERLLNKDGELEAGFQLSPQSDGTLVGKFTRPTTWPASGSAKMRILSCPKGTRRLEPLGTENLNTALGFFSNRTADYNSGLVGQSAVHLPGNTPGETASASQDGTSRTQPKKTDCGCSH